ncbi:MAG TPA: fumarylacetoacetate hydrolase family protein [Chloroflexaceae bacterium]|nr:fumarylacetoacetate hydrolase family protein [Chloroflexaceae bacterium]
MRLVTFVPPDGQPRAGALLGEAVVDLAAAAPFVIEEAEGLRWDMLSLLRGDQEEVTLDTAADILAAVAQLVGAEPDLAGMPLDPDDPGLFASEGGLEGSLSIGGAAMLYPLGQVRLLAPLPRPASLRVYAAFEEHAIALATLRGGALPPAWYRGPAFAFANHGSVLGPGAPLSAPVAESLDYGLGLACVIGRVARDLTPAEAAEAIAGYTLLNTWCARDHEELELALGLGPAKSRDFATSLGPWLATPDEIELYADDDGRLSLLLTAAVNGAERGRATAAGQFYPFAELIAHASRDVTLYPGDVIGSGPVGGGTLLEQTSSYGPWLEVGDTVTLEATGLGTLRNTIE